MRDVAEALVVLSEQLAAEIETLQGAEWRGAMARRISIDSLLDRLARQAYLGDEIARRKCKGPVLLPMPRLTQGVGLGVLFVLGVLLLGMVF